MKQTIKTLTKDIVIGLINFFPFLNSKIIPIINGTIKQATVIYIPNNKLNEL